MIAAGWTRGRLAALLVVAAALIAHATGVHGGTIAYDTPWLVVNNPILGSGSLSALGPILWGMDTGTRLTLGAEYLPVRDLTVLFDHALFGDAWALHHAHNLAWYALACLLFHRVLVVLLGDGPRALLGGLLYAVHPVHVESVAWLASRKDVVSLAFFMGALLCFMARDRHRMLAPAAGLLTLLAYWSKNTAVVLPAWMLALELLRPGRRPTLRGLLDLAWPGLAVVGGLAITLSLGDLVGMYAEPRADSLGGLMQIDAQVVARYLGMLVWPVDLGVLYPEPTPLGWSHPTVLAAAALVGGTALTGLACFRRAPLVALGTAWFCLALVPVMQLVPIQNLMADRYLLLPSAGVALALCALPLPEVARRPVFGLGLVATVLLGGVSLQQSALYRGSEAIWQRTVDTYPELPEAWANLSAAQALDGQTEAASTTVDTALRLHPGDSLLLTTSGLRAMEAGDPVKAERAFRAALAAGPGRRKAGHNLTVLLVRQGRFEEAVEVGADTVERNALYPQAWVSYGVALMNSERLEDAAAAFEEAERIDPFLPSPPCNAGGVAWLMGKRAEAGLHWQRCLLLDPDNEQAQGGLRALQQHPL